MSELPRGWAESPLEELVDILDSARVPLNAQERETRIAGKRAEDLFPYYGATGQIGCIDDFLFDEPLILLGEDGVSFLDSMRRKAYRVSGKGWVNNHAHVLRARTDVCDEAFVAAFLNSFDYTGFVTGSTRLKLTQGAMRVIPVRVAPLNEQKRIADKLDAVLARVDACRERLDRVPGILKRFRQAVLAAATSGDLSGEWRERNGSVEPATLLVQRIAERRNRLRLSSASRTINDEGIDVPDRRLPPNWTWCRVGDLADVRLGGTPPRGEPNYWGDEIPWVSSGEVANCRINRTAEQITRDGLENSNAKLYPRGTVLIAMIGEGKTRGQAAILDIDATTNQNVAGLVFDAGQVNGEYVWLWALSEYERNRDVGRGGNQPALNGAKVRALPVPLPPLEEQAEIVARVDSLLDYADRLEARYTAARAQVEGLTPALLAKAFRGELVPQDPNDEPALVLLERIRATRAASEGVAVPKRRKGGGRPKTSPKAEVPMLARKDIQRTHLATILKERGPLTAEALWSASQLAIDDFYDQLKDEEASGWLKPGKATGAASKRRTRSEKVAATRSSVRSVPP